jgi:hypothetical protein
MILKLETVDLRISIAPWTFSLILVILGWLSSCTTQRMPLLLVSEVFFSALSTFEVLLGFLELRLMVEQDI